MPDTPEPRLAGRELDAQCADEVLGIAVTWEHHSPQYYPPRPAGVSCWPDTERRMVPPYSSDLTACASLEASIARRGLQEAYVAALALLLTGNYIDCESVDLFLLVTASAESRCRAALAAVRGAKG